MPHRRASRRPGVVPPLLAAAAAVAPRAASAFSEHGMAARALLAVEPGADRSAFIWRGEVWSEKRPSWWTPAAEMAELYSVEGADLSVLPLPPLLSSLLEVGEAHTTTVRPPRNASAPPAPGAAGGGIAGLRPIAPIGAGRSWHAWLDAVRLTLSFTFVLKALCIASNIAYQMSPLPLIRGFDAAGDTGDADSAPFVSVAYGCCQYSFYGLFAYGATGRSGFLVLVYSNVLGVIIGVYYIYAFVVNCKHAEMIRLTSVYFKSIGVLILVQIYCMFAFPVTRALLFVGCVSSGWSLVSAISLVTPLPEVMKTRCSKSLQMPVLLCSFGSAILWLACGVTLHDKYIIVPNAFCLILTSVALAMAWYYPRDVSPGLVAKCAGGKYGAIEGFRCSDARMGPICSTGETA
mmetsp:Transcript_3106/g.8910  ORF Transcript_3106/g.8910 Transcript_3106/m.8910 type:complete len:405 (-) Transcript_3106:157-1371(-)